jgi:hypothetical protein
VSDFTVVETLVEVSFFDVRLLSILLVAIGLARLENLLWITILLCLYLAEKYFLGVALIEVTLDVSLGCVFGSSNFIPFDFARNALKRNRFPCRIFAVLRKNYSAECKNQG